MERTPDTLFREKKKSATLFTISVHFFIGRLEKCKHFLVQFKLASHQHLKYHSALFNMFCFLILK